MPALLTRMRELAVQASNETLTLDGRWNVKKEYGASIRERMRLTSSLTFNGINLLKNSSTRTFQVGIGTGANDKIDVAFG